MAWNFIMKMLKTEKGEEEGGRGKTGERREL